MARIFLAAEKSGVSQKLVHLLHRNSHQVMHCFDPSVSIQTAEKQLFDIVIASNSFYLPDNTPFTNFLAQLKRNSKPAFGMILLVQPDFNSHGFYPEADEFIHTEMLEFKLEQIIKACIHSVNYAFESKRSNEEKIEHLEQTLALRDKEIFSLYVMLTRKKSEMRSLNEYLAEVNGKTSLEQLEELRSRIQSYLKNENFEEPMFSYFNSNIPGFFEKPYSLNTNERRHCALIKMGLENRTIASLLMVSPGSIKKAHLRIKKKMGLAAPKSLRSFILEL